MYPVALFQCTLFVKDDTGNKEPLPLIVVNITHTISNGSVYYSKVYFDGCYADIAHSQLGASMVLQTAYKESNQQVDMMLQQHGMRIL
jgi:hypothetical protein